jgi:predicted MFS family arabinose efflux permease
VSQQTVGGISADKTKRVATLIAVACGFYMAALTARNFALPLRAADIGASKGEIGLLLGILVFTAGFVALTGAAIGERLGRRTTILAALVLSGVAQCGLAISTSVLPMYPLQVLGGIGFGITQATLFAATADTAAPGRIGRAMGGLVVGFQVGMLSGPAFAGSALLWIDTQQVIAIAAALYLVAFLLVMYGFPREAIRTRSGEVVKEIAATVRKWGFVTATLATVAWSAMWPPFLSFAPIVGKEFLRLPIPAIGLLVAGLGVLSALFAVPAGRIVDSIRDRQAVLVTMGSVLAGLVIAFGHSSGPLQGVIVLTIAVLVSSIASISVGLSYFDLASARGRGVAMGLLLTTQNLAGGAGNVSMGFLLQHFGYQDGLSLVGGMALGLLFVAILLRHVRPLLSVGVRAR